MTNGFVNIHLRFGIYSNTFIYVLVYSIGPATDSPYFSYLRKERIESTYCLCEPPCPYISIVNTVDRIFLYECSLMYIQYQEFLVAFYQEMHCGAQ